MFFLSEDCWLHNNSQASLSIFVDMDVFFLTYWELYFPRELPLELYSKWQIVLKNLTKQTFIVHTMKWFYLLRAVKVRYHVNIRCVFVCVSIATGHKCFIMKAFCKYEQLHIWRLWVIPLLQMAYCHSGNSWPSKTISSFHHCGQMQFYRFCFLNFNLIYNHNISPPLFLFIFCQFSIKPNNWLKWNYF